MIKFFTSVDCNASRFALLTLNKYESPKKNKKELIFVDPGVDLLKKHEEYPQVLMAHWLAKGHLMENEYISIDYPSDMNLKYENEFIRKSIANNLKYRDNSHYICTIQYKWLDYKDFEIQVKRLEDIYANKKKIVGLGNLCRIKYPNRYLDRVFGYIKENQDIFYWIHFYGLSLANTKKYISFLEGYAPNIQLSVDNLKWMLPVNKKLHRKYVKHPDQQQLCPTSHLTPGIMTNKAVNDEYFVEYMKEIQERGVFVEY